MSILIEQCLWSYLVAYLGQPVLNCWIMGHVREVDVKHWVQIWLGLDDCLNIFFYFIVCFIWLVHINLSQKNTIYNHDDNSMLYMTCSKGSPLAQPRSGLLDQMEPLSFTGDSLNIIFRRPALLPSTFYHN